MVDLSVCRSAISMGLCTVISSRKTSCSPTWRKQHHLRPLILDFQSSSLPVTRCSSFLSFNSRISQSYIWSVSILYRTKIQRDRGESLLYGPGGSKEKLWSRSRCLECWCHPLHLVVWFPAFLGRLVSLPDLSRYILSHITDPSSSLILLLLTSLI